MKRRAKAGEDPNQTINTYQNDTFAGRDQSITLDMSHGNINYDSTYDDASQKTPKPITYHSKNAMAA